MKHAQALAIIRNRKPPPPKGYRVSFERREGLATLRSDYFPEHGEPLIKDIEKAWTLARLFADATRDGDLQCVNVYVVDDRHSPVPGYDARAFNRYPPREAQTEKQA